MRYIGCKNEFLFFSLYSLHFAYTSLSCHMHITKKTSWFTYERNTYLHEFSCVRANYRQVQTFYCIAHRNVVYPTRNEPKNKQTYNQQNNVILGVSVIYRFVLEKFVQTVKGTRWYLVWYSNVIFNNSILINKY